MTHKHTSNVGLTAHCCQDGKPVSHAHQLLNHIIDCNATRKPQALWAEYPKSATSYDEGFIKITYGKLANAINIVAWWLVDNLGHGRDYETLAYIGPNDLSYPALMLGAVKAGYKTLLLSPRNSIEAQLHLLEVTKCKTFIVSEPCPRPVAALIDALDASYRVMKAPSVDELLQPRCKPFVYDISFEQGKDAPLLVMHTSGSTGLPKPITWPQSFVPAYGKQLQLLPPPGFESVDQLYEANRIFVVFPPFHAAFMAHAICNAMTNQTAVIFPLKGAIPSAVHLAETIKHTKVDLAFTVPLIIEELSRSPELLEDVASHVDMLAYSGGDVPQGCGDIVAARIPLVNFYGCTEGTSPALVHPEGELSRKDWKYLSFHPKAGTEFRHHADDMYELYIVRSPEFEAHQQIFTTFPDLQEFRTRDLFRRHPTNPHLWSHCGRADDTIVFLTGEKVAPVEMEQYIFSQNPEIGGVLIAGAQRFQPALLIELVEKEEVLLTSKTDLVEKFWPSIERANKSLPGHAQLAKSHILFVDPKRPMARSPKGTLQRAAVMIEYANDLNALYDAADQSIENATTESVFDLHDTQQVIQYLQSALQKSSGMALEAEDNLFVQGIDSLQTLLLVRKMKREISSLPAFNSGDVYANPTIKSLVGALQKAAGHESTLASNAGDHGTDDVSPVLTRYTELVDQIQGQPTLPAVRNSTPVYLLTGSTGSLGSYILERLLESNVAHVYCLNRSSDSLVSQKRRNGQQGLSTDFPDTKVTFLTVDLSLESFGLDTSTYTTLCQSVTHIIHNAWSVNFKVPLSSFEPQLQGIVNLVKFCATASQHPSLLYISSISAVSASSNLTIPEAIIDDPSAVAKMGYGASKFVSEHILNHAARRLHLNHLRIARVGQIAGPHTKSGRWNPTEWLPSLVKSSAQIGALPASLGPELDQVDWIHVDELASILLEVTEHDSDIQTSDANEKAEVLNIVNPNTTRWPDLLPEVTKALSLTSAHKQHSNEEVKVIAFDDWIDKIQSHFEAQDLIPRESPDKLSMDAMLATNPAFKLIDFYRDAYRDQAKTWETRVAQESSPTLHSLDSIKGEWMSKWIQAWIGN